MNTKQTCNIFIPFDQYQQLKQLGRALEKPYSELVREGVIMVLRKYRNTSKSKTVEVAKK